MIRTLLAASVTVAALTGNATTASASDAVYDCRLRSVEQNGTYQGVLTGIIASPSGGTVGIACRVTVNGTTVAQTSGTGSAVAATSGSVSFTAAATDVVRVCADATDHGTTRTTCVTVGVVSVPPQVVYDTVDWLVSTLPHVDYDLPICSVLKNLAGDYGGVLVVNSQGDVFLNGEPQYDCPPYDIVWG